MKNLYTTLLIISGLLLFIACEDNNTGPVVSSNPGAPAITSPAAGTSFTLSEDNAEDTLVVVEWSEPDYGFSAPTNYTVQMGIAGDNFAAPIEIGSTTQTSFPVIVVEMNNRLLSNGFSGGNEASVEFRVLASVNDSVQTQVSNPVPLTFMPYEVEIDFPTIFVPGSYQSASGYVSNWTPEEAPPLASPGSDDQYQGYVYMENSGNEFKFTNEPNWNEGDFGDSGNDGTLDPGGDNIPAQEAGYYFINVDLEALTYSLQVTDWAIIGSATPKGWDADTDMNYDSESKVWSITLDLTAEEIKFRANDAWDLNYGDTGADGELEQGGENIVVDEAGTYLIELDFSNPPIYTFSLTKQ